MADRKGPRDGDRPPGKGGGPRGGARTTGARRRAWTGSTSDRGPRPDDGPRPRRVRATRVRATRDRRRARAPADEGPAARGTEAVRRAPAGRARGRDGPRPYDAPGRPAARADPMGPARRRRPARRRLGDPPTAPASASATTPRAAARPDRGTPSPSDRRTPRRPPRRRPAPAARRPAARRSALVPGAPARTAARRGPRPPAYGRRGPAGPPRPARRPAPWAASRPSGPPRIQGPDALRHDPTLDLGEGEELVAGRRPVQEAFVARRTARRLLVVPQRRHALEQLVLHATSLRIPVVEVEGGTLPPSPASTATRASPSSSTPRRWSTPDEILARAAERGRRRSSSSSIRSRTRRTSGTLLRSAEASGVHGAVFPTRRQAPLSPAAVKASAGAVEHLLLAPVDDLPARSPTSTRVACGSSAPMATPR